MANIRLTLQYDGTRYPGWQRPEKEGNDRTISHKLASVLERLTGETVTLFAGAKTEPGVHARLLTVNFVIGLSPDTRTLRQDLNRYLPMDINVIQCETAPERFRADLNARTRTYIYRICTAPVYDVFTNAYTAHVHPAPDVSAMRLAADCLKGEHDFLCFSGARRKKGTTKILEDIRFYSTESEPEVLNISLTASDFLYRMPSIIIGTLLEIGQGRRAPESISRIFAGEEKAGNPCDAKGLLLDHICY